MRREAADHRDRFSRTGRLDRVQCLLSSGDVRSARTAGTLNAKLVFNWFVVGAKFAPFHAARNKPGIALAFNYLGYVMVGAV